MNKKTGFVLLCLILFLSDSNPQTVRMVDEFQIKAIFVGKIFDFITWPQGHGIENPSTKFVFGVLGHHPVLPELEKIFAAHDIKNKKVEIKFFKDTKRIHEIKKCHALFISGSIEQELHLLIAVIEDMPILTLSDTEGFGEKGVHFNFFQKNHGIRFEINPDALRRASLTANPRILFLGKIVKSTREKE